MLSHLIFWCLGAIAGACYTAYVTCRSGPIAVVERCDDVFTSGGTDRPRRQEHHGTDSRADFHLWN